MKEREQYLLVVLRRVVPVAAIVHSFFALVGASKLSRAAALLVGVAIAVGELAPKCSALPAGLG